MRDENGRNVRRDREEGRSGRREGNEKGLGNENGRNVEGKGRKTGAGEEKGRRLGWEMRMGGI